MKLNTILCSGLFFIVFTVEANIIHAPDKILIPLTASLAKELDIDSELIESELSKGQNLYIEFSEIDGNIDLDIYKSDVFAGIRADEGR